MSCAPSWKSRDKWSNAGSNSSLTIARGGIVLASFRCSLVLKASSTCFASLCERLMIGRTGSAASHGALASSILLTCCGDSAASRNILRRSNLANSASASSSRIDPFSANSCSRALSMTILISAVAIRLSSVRLYVLVTKSSS